MWELEKLPRRGTVLGSTSTTTFEGHSFESEEDLLVRETVQNSKDVPCGKAKPKVVFRSVTLTGLRKTAFLKAIELKSLYSNEELLAKTPSFSELRGIHSDRPLGLLYIEDFNTTGLNGRLDDPKGNWMRFNLYGDAAKLEEEGKIGSYGKGKAALSRAAGTNTFIVYTGVNPTKGEASTARLMGHTFQSLFAEGGGHRSGRGWFCASVTDESDPIPFTDNAAHKLAEAAGFTSRRNGETGTSFLLIGSNPGKRAISIDTIRRAVETWWWPSLLDNQLDVELWQDGRRISDPSPKLRSDLQPYIACKAKLDTGVGDAEETKFHREHGKQLGRLALSLATDESVFDHPIHPKSPGPRRVARMRARSGMITEYKDFGTERRLAFVGFFCADGDVDDVLKFSEPEEHDDWSPVNQRLARLKHGPELVKAIKERTNTACLNFQRSHSAARAPLTDRLPELERLLGAAFDQRDDGAKSRRKKPTERHHRKTVTDFPDSPHGRITPRFGTATSQFDFLVRYKLRPDETRKAKVIATISLNVAEDAQCEKGEPLEVEVIDQASRRTVYRGVDAAFPVEVSPDKARTFRIKSAPYARHQVVLFEENEQRVTEAK